MRPHKLLPASILALIAQITLAYSQTWQADLTSYFNTVRTGNAGPIPEIREKDASGVMQFLAPLLKDSSQAVQLKVCDVAYRCASKSSDQNLRQAAVELLTRACQQGGVAVTGGALRYLKTFRVSDFTTASKDNIISLVSDNHPYLRDVVMISAFLQLHALIPQLKAYKGPENRTTIRWAAIISLARMGDRDANEEMMARVRRLPVNDEVVYNVFPDLIFARTPEAISYMVEALISDASNCLSPDVEKETMIPCAYRVMEQLAGVVVGFPLELDGSGDVKATDYSQALATTRQWFRDHPNYKVRVDSY